MVILLSSGNMHWLHLLQRLLRFSTRTVKPVLFTCPLFHEVRDLHDFTKITGRKYTTTVLRSYSTSLTEPSTGLTRNGYFLGKLELYTLAS